MNILITGASKGIGKEVSIRFCQIGNHRFFLVSRDLKLLEYLKIQCLKTNPQSELYLYPFDLGNSDGLKELADRIIRDAGIIDVLINNAGSLVNKKFGEITQDEIYSMFQVNFFAPANLIRLLIPALAGSERAHVVNIGSMGGFQGSSKYPGLAYYSASKAALSVLTECLAEEYKSMKIAFNCLALGAVQTEMFSEAFPGATAPVNASEMADYIVEFAQSAHHRINGRIIPVTLQRRDK